MMASMIAVLGVSPAVAGQEYEFEALPMAVDGVPLYAPVAIANDGAVLVYAPTSASDLFVIYKQDRIEPIEVAATASDLPIWFARDINARHDVAGNNWSFRGLYKGYVGQGFIRDGRGSLDKVESLPKVSTRLTGINDSGTAVGELVTG